LKYKILLIEALDYEKYPTGGTLSFVKSLMQTNDYELSLVGLTINPSDSIGHWSKKKVNDITYAFFPLWYVKDIIKTPRMPLRLLLFLNLLRYRNEIKKKQVPNILTQSHEAAIAISKWEGNKCFYFPGLENPLKIAKYGYAKYFAFIFEKLLFRSLSKFNLIIAAGDSTSIRIKIDNAAKLGYKLDIKPFPTRIDFSIFRPIDKGKVRSDLKLKSEDLILVTTGRLAWFKGWKLMIDAFKLFSGHHQASKFIFVGDGEDKNKIINYVNELDLVGKIILVGKQAPIEVCKYLCASDLFVMGSYKEGWSTSLLEALACNIKCCVTPFSSAADLIQNGYNGFVLKDWNAGTLSEGMSNSLKLNQPKNDISKYSLSNLTIDLNDIWLNKAY
jgi:glycosyltransferase involved in cell wall biosynthesis